MDVVEPVEAEDAPDGAQKASDEAPALTLAESARGSIKTIRCMQEQAGQDKVADSEMAPPPEAVGAMEGCLDMTAARFPAHDGINLSVVYYLVPDGSVGNTGVGADVLTGEAWDLILPCVTEYWLAFPPKLSPTDEKSYTCTFNWSRETVAGGLFAFKAEIERVWAGRDAPPIGQIAPGN